MLQRIILIMKHWRIAEVIDLLLIVFGFINIIGQWQRNEYHPGVLLFDALAICLGTYLFTKSRYAKNPRPKNKA
jgi:hypothetical protein